VKLVLSAGILRPFYVGSGKAVYEPVVFFFEVKTHLWAVGLKESAV
jgi:hypothetical protein